MTHRCTTWLLYILINHRPYGPSVAKNFHACHIFGGISDSFIHKLRVQLFRLMMELSKLSSQGKKTKDVPSENLVMPTAPRSRGVAACLDTLLLLISTLDVQTQLHRLGRWSSPCIWDQDCTDRECQRPPKGYQGRDEATIWTCCRWVFIITTNVYFIWRHVCAYRDAPFARSIIISCLIRWMLSLGCCMLPLVCSRLLFTCYMLPLACTLSLIYLVLSVSLLPYLLLPALWLVPESIPYLLVRVFIPFDCRHQTI